VSVGSLLRTKGKSAEVVIGCAPLGDLAAGRQRMTRRHLFFLGLASLAAFLLTTLVDRQVRADAPLRFAVSFGADLSREPLDGRLLLILSHDDSAEPRFQISDTSLKTQQIFGIDVEGMRPGEEKFFGASVLGYPVESLAQIPPSTYNVQAMLHKYETFRRADGHVVKLPMDRGEGQQWNRAPGNLYSTPRKIWLDPGRSEVIHIALDKVIPPLPDPPRRNKSGTCASRASC
jgi:hypothetical protein